MKETDGMTTLGIYIHIPFCVQKCLYCDFLSFPEGREQQALYFNVLKREIEAAADECRGYEVVSVFIGGGTPTSVSPHLIAEVMEILHSSYNLKKDAEITIECNPGTADLEALCLYRELGINRISIGLQSAKDDELKRLGRIHDRRQFEKCYEDARAAGFENVNIDLMSALPGQSLADWESNLRYVCGLKPGPEHISAYSLIIEEGTPFYDIYGEDMQSVDAPKLPDEDTERDMYHMTKEILMENGYHRYEISNYALGKDSEKYECLHNRRYWQGGDYIGFGIGAASLMRGVRYRNTDKISEYLTAEDFTCIREEVHTLSVQEQMEEFMFLGLRMTCGVSANEFKDRFGSDIDGMYGDVIRKLTGSGLMEWDNDRLRLTDKGTDVGNYCMAEFLL